MEIEVHRANLAKHDVTAQEVIDCMRSGQRRYLRKVGRNKYQVIAQTSAGRYLELIYRELPGRRFVFHAMDARERDIKLLKRRGKRR